MIDWDKFNEYLQGYDNALILEIIDMFINDYPEKITTLQKTIDAKDFPGLDIIAHTIKANCATFGATESAELALKLELMGKNHADEDMKGVFAQFITSLEKLILELKEYRESHSS